MPFSTVERDPVVIHQQTNRVARHLTSEETIELARIQQSRNVIAYALIGMDGTEIEASGAFRTMLAPVFANIFDVAGQLGREVGERDGCPMLMLESPDFEVAAVQLSQARAVFVKRKEKGAGDVLQSLG